MEMLILLILKQGDCYGYELAGILKKQTEGIIDIKMGTLYPILYKLADDHCITGMEVRKDAEQKSFTSWSQRRSFAGNFAKALYSLGSGN